MAAGIRQQLLVQDARTWHVTETGASFADQADPEQPLAVLVDRREVVACQLVEDRPRIGLTTDIQEQARELPSEQRVPRIRFHRRAHGRLFLGSPSLLPTKQEPIAAARGKAVPRRQSALAATH